MKAIKHTRHSHGSTEEAPSGLYRDAFDAVSNAIVLIDTHTGRIKRANRAALDMYGYEQQEFLHLGLHDLCAETLSRPSGNGPIDLEDAVPLLQRHKRKDGSTFPIDASVGQFSFQDNQLGIIIVRDLTETKRAQELEKRLIHADHLASIGQLAGGVAHEINNPAAVLRANLRVMQNHLGRFAATIQKLRQEALERHSAEASWVDRRLAANEVPFLLSEMQDMLQDNLAGVERITSFTKDLMNFSRIEQDRIVLVDVNEVIHAACNTVFNEIRHRARLVKDLGKVPLIAADPEKLSQVFVNLLVNAAHAIDEGPTEQNQIRIETRFVNQTVSIAIEDTGCGISEDNLRRIFDPFYTTKPWDRGTGLGLTLCAETIRKHRGELRVSSNVGLGSRFEIILPEETELKAPFPAAESIPKPAIVFQRTRVLLIDDEPMVRKAFRRILAPIYEVVEAGSGQEGIDCLSQDQDFDVILCDLMMPEVNGQLVYEALRTTAPHLLERLVFVTGGALTPSISKFVTSVRAIVLQKPVSHELLIGVIEHLSDAKSDRGSAQQYPESENEGVQEGAEGRRTNVKNLAEGDQD